MAIPKTLLKQQQEDVFRPTKIILVAYATAKYNKVWTKKVDGSVAQAMADLGLVVKKDCELIEDSFKKYGELSFGPNEMYKMVNDPSYA